MKTSYQALRSYFKTVALAVLLAGVGFMNASCSKGGSSTAVTNPYGIYNGQIGYGTVSGTTTAIGTWGSDIELRLAFGAYGAGIAATGQMLVNYPGICGLPPGTYTVQTSQPGQVANGNSIYNLGLIANGQIPISIYQATVTSSYRFVSYGGGIVIGNCNQGMYFY